MLSVLFSFLFSLYQCEVGNEMPDLKHYLESSYLLGLGKMVALVGLRMKYSSAWWLMIANISFFGGFSRDRGVSTLGRSIPRYGGSRWMKI